MKLDGCDKMHRNKFIIRVRYGETDQMGIAYNANYLTWFEIGRTEFFRELGFTYKALEGKGVLLPLIEAYCKYINAARYDDEIEINTWVEEVKGVRIKFCYELYRVEDGKLIASGYTVHAFVNKELKPLNLKKVNEEVWNLFNKLSK